MDEAVDWSRLPTLCVSGVLRQLPCRDAIAASSVCRDWRAALPFYTGYRSSLTLTASENEHERNGFLAQLFRKRLKRLSVVLESHGRELEKFIHAILMRFCEAKALESVEFIASPQYLKFEDHSNIELLRKAITEPLLHSQRHSLKRVVLHGCGYLLPEDLQDPDDSMAYMGLRCLAATNLRLCISFPPVHPFPFASLKCVAMDYSYMDDIALKALSSLPYLRSLIVNVYNIRKQSSRIDWRQLNRYYEKPTAVTMNVISLEEAQLDFLKDYILTEDLPLEVMRIFFCGHLNLNLVKTVRHLYCDSLREFHYVDTPISDITEEFTLADMNPIVRPGHIVNQFVMLCWQCVKLETLVIHGHWLEPYDLLGMARLRSLTLRRLEVSALLWDAQLYRPDADRAPPHHWNVLYEEINSILSFDWKMTPLKDLHPALSLSSDQSQRYNYIINETLADTRMALPDIT